MAVQSGDQSAAVADLPAADHHRHVPGRESPLHWLHGELRAESYTSLRWKQNMSLWLFESEEMFDPLPNVDQMPAGFRYKLFQEANKDIAFFEGQLGATHLGASCEAVFGP